MHLREHYTWLAMKTSLPYRLSDPPSRLRKARLDNIALIPASLLPLKNTYQPLANQLPTGSVLCIPGSTKQQTILARVATFLRDHGHQVVTMPTERIIKKPGKQLPSPKNLRLAL